MKVTIDRKILDQQANFGWLNRIAAKFDDGWHIWWIENEENLANCAWLADPGYTGHQANELFIRSVARSAYPTTIHWMTIRVTESCSIRNLCFRPESAADYLEQPLTVLVEDRGSDGAFIEAILRTFSSPDLKGFLNLSAEPASTGAPRVPAWKFDSRGGKAKMAAHVRAASSASVPPRLFVLVDSDRCHAEDEVSNEIADLQEACQAAEPLISLRILKKREIENYLPEDLLRERTRDGQPLTEVFRVWCTLSEIQKDYFDLKRGLIPPKGGELNRKYSDQYSNLPTTDLAILAQSGFGVKVGDIWRGANATQEALRARAGIGINGMCELEEIVEEFKRCL